MLIPSIQPLNPRIYSGKRIGMNADSNTIISDKKKSLPRQSSASGTSPS